MGAGVASAILGGVAGSINAIGQLRQGEAQARSIRFNREKLRIEDRMDDEAGRKAERRIRGSNITAAAKSGVRVEVGSPAEVFALNAFENERDRFLKRKATQLKVDLLTFQADNVILTSTLTSVSNTISAGASISQAFTESGSAGGSTAGSFSVSKGGGNLVDNGRRGAVTRGNTLQSRGNPGIRTNLQSFRSFR